MLLTTLALAMATVGQGPSDWYEPFPAHKVIGNVYYVGSKDLATFLITTPEGHILINSGFGRQGPIFVHDRPLGHLQSGPRFGGSGRGETGWRHAGRSSNARAHARMH